MLVFTNIQKLLLLVVIFFMTNGTVYGQVWTLEQCIAEAKANNINVKISKNEMEIARQKHQEVKANLLPKVTANAEYKYYTNLPYQLMPQSVFGGPEGVYKEAQFGVPHNINANLQLTIPLFSSELNGGIEAANISAKISELQNQKTEDQMYFDITNLYYNAQILKGQIEFSDNNLSNNKKLLQNIELLYNQQLVIKADVDKVFLQAKQIETRKMVLESKYEQVLTGLRLQMGVPQDQSLDVEPAVIQERTNEYSTKPSIDIELMNAKNTLLSSQLSTLKKSRYLPSAYMYGLYGTMGYGYTEAPNEFLNFYSIGFVGVKISYPIFNGTVTNRKIKQKNLELENVELRKSLLADQQSTQITNVLRQKQVAQETIRASELQIELAQSIYNQTVLQQKEDLANLTDVLLADNAVREAQQDYIVAIVEYLKADLELKKITGNIQD